MSVNASRTLLEKFWIIKDREKELYYNGKRAEWQAKISKQASLFQS